MKKNTPFFNILITAGSLFLATQAAAQNRHYVKATQSGTGDGTSWENASADLQLMINNSVSGDTIWVAGGTYKPIRKANALDNIALNDRDNAFVLKDSVLVYGGFAGNEALLTERDLTLTQNASILSGDFNGDDAFEYVGDILNIANNTENAYHVVITVAPDADPITGYTRLDGFTITGGNANDSALTSISVNTLNIYRYAGGGIINRNSSAPTLENLIITGNYAIYGGGAYNRYMSNCNYINVLIDKNIGQFGGGVANWNTCAPVFNNAVISNNRADAGGGVYNFNNSNPSFTEVEISNNFASLASGGGIFSNNSSPVLNEITVSGNTATVSGGGLFNTAGASPIVNGGMIADNQAPVGGGIYANGNCNLTLTDVEISGNQATDGNGGGYYNFQSQPVLKDVTFTNNSATGYGGGMANWTGGNASITGGMFEGNTSANGAGVFNFDNSDAVFTGVHFENNTATGNGGGANNRQGSDVVFTNCLLNGNVANYGGGIYSYDNANPVLTNVTLAGNEALIYGGGIASDSSSPLVRNSIIYSNTATETITNEVFNYNNALPSFAYSLVAGTQETWDYTGTDGGNNVQGDPLFTNAEGGNYTLQLLSPARNAGNNGYFEEGQVPDLSAITLDLAGNPRFYQDGIVDIGAFEIQDTLGLPSLQQLQVTTYPNPVINVLNINTIEEITSVVVYNMLGQPVSATWNSADKTLNMANLQAGNYVVKLTVGKATGSVPVVKK